jgi:hypothetical protein
MSWLQKLQAAYGNKPQATQQPSKTGEMPNTGNPAEGATPTAGVAPTTQNPLDFYASLQQNTGNPGTPAPQFNIPTETISKAAQQLNFANSIPPEALAKLQAGDLSALSDVLNSVGRSAYQAAIEHSTAVTGSFIDQRFQHEQGLLDGRISSKLVTSNLTSIKNLHPVAQGMFKDTVDRLRTQYPGASQEELESASWEIFQDMSGQFDRNGQQQQQQAEAEVIDYDVMGGFADPASPTQ